MRLSLEPDSPTPLFEQLHDGVIDAIVRSELRPGDKLDPVRRIAAEFGINPATVQKAYDLLRAEGIIRTEQRSGSVIIRSETPTDEQKQQLSQDITRIAARALVQGFSAREINEELESVLNTYMRMNKGLA